MKGNHQAIIAVFLVEANYCVILPLCPYKYPHYVPHVRSCPVKIKFMCPGPPQDNRQPGHN